MSMGGSREDRCQQAPCAVVGGSSAKWVVQGTVWGVGGEGGQRGRPGSSGVQCASGPRPPDRQQRSLIDYSSVAVR